MRNLTEYPVTGGEAISALQEAQELFYNKYKHHMGSINGLALFYAERFIREHKEEFDQFTQLPQTTDE